ncbi:MAG: hypothetical protein ACOYVJ_12280 [Nitrospirota bacterium]
MIAARQQTERFREYCGEHCEMIATIIAAMIAGVSLVIAIV